MRQQRLRILLKLGVSALLSLSAITLLLVVFLRNKIGFNEVVASSLLAATSFLVHVVQILLIPSSKSILLLSTIVFVGLTVTFIALSEQPEHIDGGFRRGSEIVCISHAVFVEVILSFLR